MGVGCAPTWLRQVSPPPLLHKTTLTTEVFLGLSVLDLGPMYATDSIVA